MRNNTRQLVSFAAVLVWCAAACGPENDAGPWREYPIAGLPEMGNTGIVDVLLLSDADGWAVTRGGHFLHYDGAQWKVHTDFSGAYDDLWMEGISFGAPDDGWAVGHDETYHPEKSYIFHYDGERWSLFDLPPVKRRTELCGLFSVCAAGPRDVWFGGPGVAYRYHDGAWSRWELADGASIIALGFSSPTNGWAVGAFTWRWDGSGWTKRERGGLHAIACPGGNNAWGVGGMESYAEIPGYYYLGYWDESGGSWFPCDVDFTRPYSHPFHDVNFAGPDDGWAAGCQRVIRCDGERWYEVPSPDDCFSAVFTLGGDDVWLAGSGSMFKFDPSAE